MLNVKNVTKQFDGYYALNGVSMEIDKGSIIGLLGPNGAGKSTLINIISSLLKPTSGSIEIFGKDASKDDLQIKQNIGIVFQDLALYEELSVIDNMRIFGSFYHIPKKELEDRIAETLELVALTGVKKKKVKHLSGGMKRKLNMACSIIHRPKLIILDEPTVGVDAMSRNHILESIKTLNKNGATIIYTSHYITEVEDICDIVYIINKGRIIEHGSIDYLKDLVSDKVVIRFSLGNIKGIDINDIKEIKYVENTYINENTIDVILSKDANILDQLISYMLQKNAQILNVNSIKLNLEQVFLSLTGDELND